MSKMVGLLFTLLQVVSAEDSMRRLVADVQDVSLPMEQRQTAWQEIERRVHRGSSEPAWLASVSRQRAYVIGAAFLADAYHSQDDMQQRLERTFERALDLARELDFEPRIEARLSDLLARRFLHASRLREAEDLLDGAILRLGEECPDYLPFLLAQRAALLRLLGWSREALADLAHAEQALDPVRFPRHALLAPALHQERGLQYLVLGMTDAARRCLADQRRAAAGLTSRLVEQNLLLQDVRLDWARSRFDRCLVSAERALARCEQQARDETAEQAQADPVPFAELRAQLSLYRILARREQDRRGGRVDLEAVSGALERLVAQPLPRTERLIALLEWADTEVEGGAFDRTEGVLRDVEAELTARAGGDPQAPVTQATVQWRALVCELSRRRRSPALGAHFEALQVAYERFLEDWSRTPRGTDGVGFLHFRGRRAVISELLESAIALHGPDEGTAVAFDALLRSEEQGSLARALGAGPCRVADFQARVLGPEDGVLVFVPAPRRSHLFALDREGLRSFPLPAEDAFDRPREALLTEILVAPAITADGREATPARDRARAAADELARLLLPEDARPIVARWKHILVVGQDLLGAVPLACLPWQGPVSMGEHFAISDLPSLPVGQLLAQRTVLRRASDLACIAVHAPVIAAQDRIRWPGLQTIPLGEEGSRHLLSGFPPAQRAVFFGDLANADVWGFVGRQPARLLEILAHGVYDEQQPVPTGMVLAARAGETSGVQFCPEVERALSTATTSCPPLVILAVCSSGRGPLRRGDEGMNHWGGLFLRRGATAVIATPADLDFEATRRLLGALHEHLQDGRVPAEALRRARVDLLRHPAFRHPYFTDHLHLLGLGNRF